MGDRLPRRILLRTSGKRVQRSKNKRMRKHRDVYRNMPERPRPPEGNQRAIRDDQKAQREGARAGNMILWGGTFKIPVGLQFEASIKRRYINNQQLLLFAHQITVLYHISKYMKIGLSADRHAHTCTHSIYSLHNCPSCRCAANTPIYPNTHTSPPYFHKICQPRFRQSNPFTAQAALSPIFTPNSNIYISKPADIIPIVGRNINKFMNSSVFDSNRRRDDYCESRSLAKTNITFTYVSPSKEKQHRSSDGKFSTKQFKQKHFPFLQCHEKSIETQQQSHKISDNLYYTTYTQQSPPKKHKLLGINKSKSKNKLKTVSSHLSQKQLSMKDSAKQETPKEKQNIESEVDYQRVTPINALWEKINQNPAISHPNLADVIKKPVNPNHRPSIELMDLQKSDSSDQVATQKESTSKYAENSIIYSKPVPSNLAESIANPSVDNNNTTKIGNQRQSQLDMSHSEREERSNFWRQKSIKLSDEIVMKGLQGLSEQLSEQLQLNYDYYSPSYDYCVVKNDSDRSVSVTVSLY